MKTRWHKFGIQFFKLNSLHQIHMSFWEFCCSRHKAEISNNNDDYNPLLSTVQYESCMSRSKKPIIYFYSKDEKNVEVKIEVNGKLSVIYPNCQEKNEENSFALWKIKTHPDGKISLQNDKNSENPYKYSSIFWEGLVEYNFSFSNGFIVKKEDIVSFLEEKLREIGLIDNEINEFIIYWLPKLSKFNYLHICFQNEEYTKNARLTITPKPDSLLRVFMTFCGYDEAPGYTVPPQTFEPFERGDFTVVEWGGLFSPKVVLSKK
ncbi:hypothetical protein TRFO_39113 [Tritrichomonas foetus]|uniref:Uncharacterized protein n=1 Tax=Tritrichomonas foetus TaxID=1144522 RepID=A0A1J4J8W9_9EUKA|nr:hypothetical protein TRFO_39113 [Tritrichomonas foetus]|eukprot:OHS94695.1 hypothetical protein TRFO_39113 [Tritrichomonas foetus]